MKESISILPPMRFIPPGEIPPELQTPLKDLKYPAINIELIDGLETYQPLPHEYLLSADRVREIEATVLDASQIAEFIKGKRVNAIGASMLTEKRKEGYKFLFVIYDYQDNMVLETILDEKLQILNITHTYYQPAPTIVELNSVLEIARKDKRIADHISDSMVGNAILINNEDKDSHLYHHRLLDVRFGYPDERLPLCKAIVDLSDQRVICAELICLSSQKKEVCHGC